MGDTQFVKQAIVVAQDELNSNRMHERLALFNSDGTPFSDSDTTSDIWESWLTENIDIAELPSATELTAITIPAGKYKISAKGLFNGIGSSGGSLVLSTESATLDGAFAVQSFSTGGGPTRQGCVIPPIFVEFDEETTVYLNAGGEDSGQEILYADNLTSISPITGLYIESTTATYHSVDPPSDLTEPTITEGPSDQTVVAGANATFTATASGNPDPTIQWYVSTDSGDTFNEVSEATSTTLTIDDTTMDEDGYEYYAIFTNSQGTAQTSTVTLTVNAVPSLTIDAETDGLGNATFTENMTEGGGVVLTIVGPTLTAGKLLSNYVSSNGDILTQIGETYEGSGDTYVETWYCASSAGGSSDISFAVDASESNRWWWQNVSESLTIPEENSWNTGTTTTEAFDPGENSIVVATVHAPTSWPPDGFTAVGESGNGHCAQAIFTDDPGNLTIDSGGDVIGVAVLNY